MSEQKNTRKKDNVLKELILEAGSSLSMCNAISVWIPAHNLSMLVILNAQQVSVPHHIPVPPRLQITVN